MKASLSILFALLLFFGQGKIEVKAQSINYDLPADRAWFNDRIEWMNIRSASDTARAYQTLDSLTLWIESYGDQTDHQEMQLAHGRYLINLGKYARAMHLLNQMISDSNDARIQAQTLLALRDLHFQVGAIEQSLRLHNLINWNLITEQPEHAAPSAFIAFAYARIGSYKMAIDELKQAINKVKAAGMNYYTVSYLNNLGVFFLKDQRAEEAIDAWNQAMEALNAFFPDGEGMAAPNYSFIKGLIQGNIAQALADQGKHFEAIPLYKLDIAASLPGNPPYQYRENGIISLIQLTQSYLATGQLKLAEQSLKRAKTLLQPTDDAELWITAQEATSKLLQANGFPEEAYNMLIDAKRKSDSVDQAEKRRQADALLNIYSYSRDQEVNARMLEIMELRARADQQERNQYLFIAMIVLALVISIYSSLMYRLNQKRRQTLEAKNLEVQQQKQLLEEALNQRDTLLREVNHRVKNNLQVIASMLYLEQRKLKAHSVRKLLRDLQDRINTMSKIHQKLYVNPSDKNNTVDLSEYLKDLLKEIIASYQLDRPVVRLNCRVSMPELPVDQMVPMSFILHELTTNSMKHAFNEQENCLIEVRMHASEHDGKQWIVLEYADNGVGLPDDHEAIKDKHSLGTKIIDLLSRQMQGEITQLSGDGFQIQIRFPSQKTRPTFAE